MFDYALPLHAATKPDDKNQKPPSDDKKKPPKGKDDEIRTQMVGEKPGDDLGYDPKQIPTEDIPD